MHTEKGRPKRTAILLTSLSDEQYEERGLLLGAVDYVAKPFSPVIIKARVNTHMDTS